MEASFLLYLAGAIMGLVRIEWYYVGRSIDKAHIAAIAEHGDRGATS